MWERILALFLLLREAGATVSAATAGKGAEKRAETGTPG
jgi:hypothetical protein